MNIACKIFNRLRRIKYTHFNSHIAVKNGCINGNNKTKLILAEGSVINLNGNLTLNGQCLTYDNGRSSILRMDKNSVLNVKGDFSFCYGADIVLLEGATLELGKNGYVNVNCKIRCRNKITIGDDGVIAHDFTVMDSDCHFLNGDRNTSPVVIGDHVWIGTRVTVLSGVTIGEGAVIGAGSVVKDDIPAHCLAVGVPARVIKENVEWEV
ncbi:MAG: acyltransferase [Lachnospiraceae bacterium]|nr:acyltransferase [Lachnospiraceae bacterium]